MPQECTKCNIVWSDSTLEAHSPQRGWVEENIVVCPQCKSGLDLHTLDTVNTYSMSLTGVITNDLTSKVKHKPIKAWKEKDVDFFYSEPVRGNYVADGTTCLCCAEKLPSHKVKCVLYGK